MAIGRVDSSSLRGGVSRTSGMGSGGSGARRGASAATGSTGSTGAMKR